MLLKHYNSSGIVTWSNSKTHSNLLACAPLPNTQNGPFNLEILALDIAEKNKQLSVLGSVPSSKPFRCLAWDVFGQKNGKLLYQVGTHPSGLIFGGMEDGGITLWDPSQIIAGKRNYAEPDTVGLVYQEEPIYDYPIICAQWNSLQPNLLGLGTTEVLAMDIGQGLGKDPNIFKISDKNPHAGSYITAVAWNKQVAHIMASASDNGLIALWDVKVNKPIFSFNDNNHGLSHKNISIAWSKSVFAQIAVTLDDQNKNELQIWDLRNQKGPIIVIDKNHSKGINCMDWSDNDPQLILASSKDNKVICWNYVREQPVSEMQLSEPVVDIKWSKKLPSIYYVSTQSKLEVYTMDDNNLYSYVPKWYKIPVGTTIGPNNSILSFDDKENTTLKQYKYNFSNQKLTPSIKNLQSLLKNSNLEGYLRSRKEIASNEQQQFWSLMELMSNDGVDSDIYNYLGFDKDNIVKSAQKYTSKKYDSHSTTTTKVAKTNVYISKTGEQASDFFAKLGDQSQGNTKIDHSQENQNVKYDMVPRNSNWDTGKQKIIKQNLLIGNYTGAIDAALKCGRCAEALVIAYSQRQQVFKSTLKAFFTETTDPFITGTLRYIADRELQDMVKKYPLHQWKQCVAFIYSLVRDHRAEHLKSLAQRLLEDTNQKNNALICLALAEDFNALLQIFNKSISGMENGIHRKIEVLNLIQKLYVITRISTKQIKQNTVFDRFVLEAALILIEEGQLLLANQVLNLGNANDEKIIHLRYTVAQFHPATRNKLQNPFRGVNIPLMQKKATKKLQQQQLEQNPNQQAQKKNTQKNSNNNLHRPQPKQVSRPSQPIFPPKEEQTTSFNPNNSNRNTTGVFNPVEAPSTTIQPPPSRPNITPPPPSNIKKPINPSGAGYGSKNFDIPVNIPPRRQEYSNPVSSNQNYGQSSFNPNFNPSQQTQSSHLNIPASNIPSINVRNKPPPPPPKTIKKVESFQQQKLQDYHQNQHNTSFQHNTKQQYQHPPPPPNRTNHPPPPPPSSNYQKQEQSNSQQNIPQPPPVSQSNYQNQSYGYQQPPQIIQNKQPPPPQIQPQIQTPIQPQIQAPINNPPPAARKPVPPPPRRGN